MLDAMVEMDRMRKVKDITSTQVAMEASRASRSTAVEI